MQPILLKGAKSAAKEVQKAEQEHTAKKKKSPCPTLIGRKTKALSIKTDSDRVHVNMFIQ